MGWTLICFEIKTKNERLLGTSVMINQPTTLVLVITEPGQSRLNSFQVNDITLMTNNLRAEGSPSLQGIGRTSTGQCCAPLEQERLISLLL